jgi:hypothetical protein
MLLSANILVTVTGEREDLSAALVHHFTAAGWKQRAPQYLNPISPTSFDEGWRHRCGCVLQTAQEILLPTLLMDGIDSSKPAFRELTVDL